MLCGKAAFKGGDRVLGGGEPETRATGKKETQHGKVQRQNPDIEGREGCQGFSINEKKKKASKG